MSRGRRLLRQNLSSPWIDLETMLNFIRTRTDTGLTVNAYLLAEDYDTAVKISD